MGDDMQHFIEFFHIAIDYMHTKLSEYSYCFSYVDQLCAGFETRMV